MRHFLVIFTLFFLTYACVHADTLENKHHGDSSKTLRFSTDPICPPLAFRNPLHFDTIIGAEYEIFQAIVKELEVPYTLSFSDYESLIVGLQSGHFDAVFGSIIITHAKAEEVLFAEPHIITYGQLFTHKDSGIRSVRDCNKKRVGVIRTTELETFLSTIPGVIIIPYSFEMLAFRDLNYNRLDAVLLEAPYGLYYTYSTPDIIPVGEPIGELQYAFALPLQSTALRDKINIAINHLKQSGKLQEILTRWNIWNPLQAQSMDVVYKPYTDDVDFKKYASMVNYESSWRERVDLYVKLLPRLLRAAIMTIQVSIMSMLFAIVLGLVLALGKVYGPTPLRWGINFYIEVFRGTPLLIQLLFIFYGLPSIGITLSPLVAAIIGLGLNYAAYEAEIYRSGILSIPQGQMEAARALGMSHIQGLRYVVIPQAVRVVVPPVTNDFISLLKDSSLVSVITITELTFVYNHVASTYYDYFGTGILVAVLYLIIGLPFLILSRWAEKRLGRSLF